MPKVSRNFVGYLEDLIQKAGVRDATEKMESKLQTEMKRAQGIDSRTAVQQSLDDLAKMEEFDGLKDQIRNMLDKSEEREKEFDFVKKAREKKIAMQYAEMSTNYGRIFTPSR